MKTNLASRKVLYVFQYTQKNTELKTSDILIVYKTKQKTKKKNKAGVMSNYLEECRKSFKKNCSDVPVELYLLRSLRRRRS